MITSHNRYNDIIPYQDTLVKISGHPYINANFIDGSVEGSEEMFIATQGPL